MEVIREQFNTTLDKRLKKGLKMHSVVSDEDMNLIIERLIKKELKESGYDFGEEINKALSEN